MQIVDMTRADAMIMYNPNRDLTNEERIYKADYSIKEANVVLTRARISILIIESVLNSDAFIFYFWYPRFSYTCWAFLHFFIYFFDSQYFLTYLTVGLIFLIMQKSQVWKLKLSPLLEKTFFSTSHLHKSLKSACAINILSSDDISKIKSVHSLLESEGEEVIAQTKDTYNIKDKGMIN